MRKREIGKCPSITRIKIRRGISNVVSSAILLSAVSIMGVMMLAWSNTTMMEQKMELQEVFSTQMNKISEDLIFENVWFAIPAGVMTENHLNVTLTNIGISGLNVTEIHVTNVTGTNTTNFIYYHTDGGIPKSGSFSTNATFPWITGDELNILIFTDRGNQFITQVVAP